VPHCALTVQASSVQDLIMRFECAGRYMSTSTTVVQISACYIFYKAGIRSMLVLGRHKYNEEIIDSVCFQVHISSQNHGDMPTSRVMNIL
jgi:hypothetical protein